MLSQRTKRKDRRRASRNPTSSTNKQTWHILELPDDVLYVIFSKCDKATLGRLSCTCQRLNHLLQTDSPWLSHSAGLTLVRSPNCRSFEVCLKEHCRVSLNWKNAYFQNKNLLHFNKRQMPWMQYEADTLWVSSQNAMSCYTVQSDGQLKEESHRHLYLPSEDVSRFVVKNNIALSGCRDGSLYMFDCTSSQLLLQFPKVHQTDAQAVDFTDTCIVSGSRDHTVKILQAEQEVNSNPIRSSLLIDDRVWSLSLSPSGRNVSVGTAACRSASVSVWDVERGERLCSLDTGRFGAGMLDVQYESDQTVLSCGYDSTLRLWDTRTARCELCWEEPHDSTLYCLKSDGDVSIVTGTAYYGMVRLWDKRSLKPVQLFYLGRKNSPVYSVAMDTCHLYAALDMGVTMGDFSILPP